MKRINIKKNDRMEMEMRKIILGLFIILLCFSIGIAELQEEELSKEERAKIEKKIERLKKEKEELHDIFNYLFEKFDSMDKEIEQLEIKLQGKDLLQLMKEASKPEEEYDFSFLDSIKPLEEKKKEDLSWEEKYRMYPSIKYWLDSLKEPDERYLEKIEEENDRLEDLLSDLKSERFLLDLDMMRHRWDLELAKPNPLDYYVAAELGISLAMMDIELGIYRYYPSYSTKTDRTNYEPLLFTLCTDSKGKMDWTKYGWLKLLLKNK